MKDMTVRELMQKCTLLVDKQPFSGGVGIIAQFSTVEGTPEATYLQELYNEQIKKDRQGDSGTVEANKGSDVREESSEVE